MYDAITHIFNLWTQLGIFSASEFETNCDTFHLYCFFNPCVKNSKTNYLVSAFMSHSALIIAKSFSNVVKQTSAVYTINSVEVSPSLQGLNQNPLGPYFKKKDPS